MKTINPNSLSGTLDNINEILFYGKKISSADKLKASKWIASRQGLPKSYPGMFAPTEYDYKNGVILFTGEKITTGAGTAHMLSEEACRALLLLNGNIKASTEALNNALKGLDADIRSVRGKGIDTPDGYYCCGKCSVSYWRNLSAQGSPKSEKLLISGLKILKAARIDSGKWKRFPFFYTLYALLGIDNKPAIDEMRYAAPVLEKYARRSAKDKYGKRKIMLAEKVLSII
jgi:hypothetical protein